MVKLKVNPNICIGCGACQATYPETFEINDEGVATVINNDNTNIDGEIEIIEDICPVGAISDNIDENN